MHSVGRSTSASDAAALTTLAAPLVPDGRGMGALAMAETLALERIVQRIFVY